MVYRVDQTRLHTEGGPPGNCFQACLASVLEIPLDVIPDQMEFWKQGEPLIHSWRAWWLRFREWCREKRIGYLEIDPESAFDPLMITNIPCIVTGKSPRADINHSVVMMYQAGWQLLHDPHPSRAGIGEMVSIGFILVRTPGLVFGV